MGKKNTLGKRDMTGGRAFAFIGMVLAVFLMVFAFAFRSQADENPVVIPDDYCGWLSFGPEDLSADTEFDIDGNDEDKSLSKVSLPSNYDARSHGQVSPVRNQGQYSTCWAFAMIGSLESSLLSQHIMSDPDLSEKHLVKYSFQNVLDPLGGTAGDSMHFSGGNPMEAGGDTAIFLHTMENWHGAVSESYAPYNGDLGNRSTDDAFNHDVVHMQNCFDVRGEDDLKSCIMEYGGVAVGMYYNDENLNNRTNAYYAPVNKGGNHGILLVGWDDNYSRNNFNVAPPRDGAWLCKNSWGTSFGDGGYFWMSYCEPSFSRNGLALVGERADNYDHNYQYDGSYWYDICKLYGKTTAVANVFTVQGNTGQELQAVSLHTGGTTGKISIQIYKNPTDSNNPESGILMLETPQIAEMKYSGGYQTIKLSEKVCLEPGSRFAVVMTFSRGEAAIRTEDSGVYHNFTFTASAKPGQSYAYSNGFWYDYGAKNNKNIRIKAFTKDTGIYPNGIGLNADRLKLTVGESYTLKATVVPDNAIDKSVKYKSENPSVATVDQNGLVKAVGTGKTVISARTVNGLIKNCEITVIKNPTSVTLDKTSATVYFGESVKLTATVLPADATDKSVTWSVDKPSIAGVNNGTVKVWGAGIFTVTAKTSNNLMATCRITALADNVAGNPFADIKASGWQYDAAKYVYDRGYMTGKGELIPGRVLFSPNTAINRSQFVQTLYSVEGCPEVTYSPVFKDVPEGKWYTNAVIWAASNGIVSGTGDGSTFSVDGAATREQLAAMFYKYAVYKGYDVSEGVGKKIPDFSDADKVSPWAVNALNWAVSNGIISGKGNESTGYRLDPNGTATRCECAAILRSFLIFYENRDSFDTFLTDPVIYEESMDCVDDEIKDEADDEIKDEADDEIKDETDEEIKDETDEEIKDETDKKIMDESDREKNEDSTDEKK